MKSFNVIIEDNGVFKPYDIIPTLVESYKTTHRKYKDLKEFVKSTSMYYWWSRCEYEIVLCQWPKGNVERKIDVYEQIMMNFDIVVNILKEELNV